MKAADISDSVIYEMLASATWEPSKYLTSAAFAGKPRPLMTFDVMNALPQFPRKIVMAKIRQMIAKKRLNGCPCGCRGDLLFPWERFGGPYDQRHRWQERLAEYFAAGRRRVVGGF